MRIDVRRRQLQRLMDARCSTAAWAVESYLRVEAAPSGLFTAGADVIAARVGLRTRSQAARALTELLELTPPLLVYDAQACVGYWLHSAVESPCAGPRDFDARRRWALKVIACEPRRLMLAELASAERSRPDDEAPALPDAKPRPPQQPQLDLRGRP
jgi:hypothetical protein